MTGTIIAALIAAAATLAVCLINNAHQQKRLEAQLQLQREEAEAQRKLQLQEAEKKHDETIRLIDYKLEQLTKKVDLHNNAVERLYKVEKQLGIDEEKIKSNKHRIEDLEQFHKP